MTEYLSIRNVTKRYRDFEAVRDISLDVRRGEFVTFLGPSGSGKSTLLYIISGLSDPTSGQISLHGRSLLGVPANRRNIGMVFQRYTLIPHLTVADNIAFPLRVRGLPKARVTRRLQEMLELVRLAEFANRMPSQLSGGQQQRVALARALSYEPEILLMDEPLAALDKSLKEDLQLEIRRIHREVGTTIVYVTHDQEEALRLSDRIAVFNRGVIEQIAEGEILYNRPANAFVAGFVGNSNILPAVLASVTNSGALAALPDGGQLEVAPPRDGVPSGTRGMLLLRPEDISISDATYVHPPSFEVVVVDVSNLGEIVQILAKTSWGQELKIRVRSQDARKLAPGQGVRAIAAPGRSYFLNE